ncbi:WXG100 family type VII secretion target [Streptomyces sp. NPDC018019]|uniref:WXG100 family type VII secretion target n=1 Tax=Streptomyces sp. NPDC018019 TaxID=3365030 RepID=UPI0037B24CEA
MGAADKAKEIVQDLTGMWWPEGDEDELREAARAWRTFADDVEDVTAAAHKPAQDVIDNNKGPGIEAFGAFWRKYHGGGKGYLDDVASAARDMAKALDKFADEIATAKKQIEHALEIAGAVLVAGTALALFTGGISEVAAAGATEAIVAAASTAGVAVSATVAEIAGTVLATAAIGSVEAITVDIVVAQGGRNLLGEQKGINLHEAAEAGLAGGALGGAFGGAARGVKAVADAGGIKNVFSGMKLDSLQLRPAIDQMGKRRTWELYRAESSDAMAPPAKPGDDMLPSGHPIYHGKQTTTIGYDTRTLSNAERVRRVPGLHDIVVHGTDEGTFIAGHMNPAGKMKTTYHISPHQVVEAIRNNPNYTGGPVRLVSCHSGAGAEPLGQSVANELGVRVYAPTNRMGVDRKLGIQEPVIDKGGYWRIFLPITD